MGSVNPLQKVVYVGAAIFVALFAVWWLVICGQTYWYDPSQAEPRLEVSDFVSVVAGFLATSVAAGTATVLGITIQEIREKSRSLATTEVPSRRDAFRQTLTNPTTWLARGCYVYMFVGLVVLFIYAFFNKRAPEMMSTFALSALGWIAGCFSATFKASG